jgi:hypothetical protein
MPKKDDESPDLETPAGRFKWFALMAYGGLPQFIAKNELNASQIYRVAKGGSVPKLDYCVVIAQLGLNIHWWGTGEGPWYAPNREGARLARKIGDDPAAALAKRIETRVTAVVQLEQGNEIGRVERKVATKATRVRQQ